MHPGSSGQGSGQGSGQPQAQPHPHATQPAGPSLLEAPWRLQYLEALGDAEKQRGGPPQTGSGSFLLDYWLSPQLDATNHVLHRDATGMVLLNKFPYASGHLLCALGEARPTLLDYTPQQRASLWRLVDIASAFATLALQPQGLNIGVNQGRAAGAGVPQHLHAHVVPRWGGDVNFITVVGQVRVNSGSLQAMYERFVRVREEALRIAGA
jgi:ATP adenylyltransferase